MKKSSNSLTILGYVTGILAAEEKFILKCRSGDSFEVFVSVTTTFNVLMNLDGLNIDRVANPPGWNSNNPSIGDKINKYVARNALLVVKGILYENESVKRFEGRSVYLLHSKPDHYAFEDTHWWLSQMTIMADQWLDDLFGDKRSYLLDDFSELYRTNLNILGLPTDDDTQETATLSRLIYGLSSAYLLTGGQRYLQAAKAGVDYQRSTFRRLSHDGKYCFWNFGKKRLRYGTENFEYSLNPDDFATIPLYEQIYGVAGLTQYFRITDDTEVLQDIQRTVRTFNNFYLDSKSSNPDFPGNGGYFSHIDYSTMRPDSDILGQNKSKKNWNSIGDHVPAYLINLILTMDPLPLGRTDTEELNGFLVTCKKMLKEITELIVGHFPDKDPTIPFVQERFLGDWTPDLSWGWQQNRAIVGHNFKIAWNLTRLANYYNTTGEDPDLVQKINELATRLADQMSVIGIDQIRGGCFDAVERKPSNGEWMEFVWGNTKDFWQQEQAILAFLILHGYTKDEVKKKEYLAQAREMTAFWNLFFLDHDNRGIFFRVVDNGLPFIEGIYGDKASHSIAGYHSFELNFLAHIYIRSYVNTNENSDNNFVLYFRPDERNHSINVLPDFFPKDLLEISAITINGVKRNAVAPSYFQVELSESELGGEVIVEFVKKNNE